MGVLTAERIGGPSACRGKEWVGALHKNRKRSEVEKRNKKEEIAPLRIALTIATLAGCGREGAVPPSRFPDPVKAA